MKYVAGAAGILLVLFLLGDYVFFLFAFLLGAAAIYCLYRAAKAFGEWKMTDEEWKNKLAAEEEKELQKLQAAEQENAEEKPRRQARSRNKREKADGFMVVLFVMLSFIPGYLSVEALSYSDGAPASVQAPAANFSPASATITGAEVSSSSLPKPAMAIITGVILLCFGAIMFMLFIASLKYFRRYSRKILTVAAGTFVCGGVFLAVGTINFSKGNEAADTKGAAVVASTSAESSSSSAAANEGNEAKTQEKSEAVEEKSESQTTVVSRAEAVQDKEAVKKYLDKGSPMGELAAAKKIAGLHSFEKASPQVLTKYMEQVGKLAEKSLSPAYLEKGAEETAKLCEEYYSAEFLIAREYQKAKEKSTAVNEKNLKEISERQNAAMGEIVRLAKWSGGKI